jgi:hypothetical protein
MDLAQLLYTMEKIEIQVFYFFLMLNRTVVIVLVERIKEISGGEEDDLGKY